MAIIYKELEYMGNTLESLGLMCVDFDEETEIPNEKSTVDGEAGEAGEAETTEKETSAENVPSTDEEPTGGINASVSHDWFDVLTIEE